MVGVNGNRCLFCEGLRSCLMLDLFDFAKADDWFQTVAPAVNTGRRSRGSEGLEVQIQNGDSL